MPEPNGARALDEIRRRLAAQTRSLAIKLHRDATGAGLAEARAAVARMQAGSKPAAAAPPPAVRAEAIGEALRAGNKNEAIRLYRAATGAGLDRASDAIDAIEAEKRAGPRPPATTIVERRRTNPILVLIALAVLFGTVFGLVVLLAGG